MNILKNWLIFLLNFISFVTFAQIQITFPVSRIVFQRNNQNQASVNIAGSYFQQLDMVEMRAVPVWGGQGVETSWKSIPDFRNNGHFSGTIQLNGGWYNVEVRGILNGNIVTSATLERVGVGEVFIVAGQSNAQGDQLYSGATIGATDDRVSTINFYDPLLNEENLPFQFSQMSNNSKMAPYNYVPWFWAKLGDKLTQRLNVPVLFYGAALGGLSCEVWRRSAQGEDLRKEFSLFVKVAGMPYRGMKAAIQQYVTRTGIRAILWQQGESDGNSNGETYYNNLKTVIEKSRSDSKKEDLAWVVARSSRNPSILPTVIQGQNLTIERVKNVFSGPPTDEIIGSAFRADGIHFHNDGLSLASDYWNEYLNENFFSNSQPLMARSLPVVNIACNPNNTTNKFTISTGGYPFYKWSNGGTSNFITVSNGTYSFKCFDEVGNTVFSQPFSLSTDNNETQPSIIANGNTTFCDGQDVILTSNIKNGNVWSNGERGQSIVARGSGNYFVVNYSLNGCPSPASASINVNVLPTPLNFINTSKALPICPNETIELFTTNNDGVSFNWNTNETSKKISVNKAGSYSLRIRGQNGCESLSFIEVNFRSRPSTAILADGETSFCLGKSVNIFPKNDFESYVWNTGATSKTLNVRLSGIYTLRVKDSFGCLSDTIAQNITVNPLPIVKIKADGQDKFCEGNAVILSTQTQGLLGYKWNTGATSKEIYAMKEGLYTLSVLDGNGCESIPDSINLIYTPLPIASITSADEMNTFCEGSSLSLVSNDAVSYLWSTGATTKGITVEKAGVYSLKVKDDNNCLSKSTSFEVFVKSIPPAPEVYNEGAFQLSAIPKSTFLNQFYTWKKDNEDLSIISSVLKANASGKYSTRTAWPYSLTNGKSLICYSPYSNALEVFIPYLDKGLRVYPNPNPTGVFTIETIGDNPNAEVALFTLTGQKVYTGFLNDLKEKRNLDFRHLEKGVYIIRLISGSYEASSRIIIK